MNRILFAAARGARIQQPYPEAGGWFNSCDYFFWGDEGFYRIHPEDAALEYGPVSSALRRMAETGELQSLKIGGVGVTLWVDESEVEWLCATPMHRSLFLLLMSEGLADEGL